MCNLYSITKGQRAIIEFTRAMGMSRFLLNIAKRSLPRLTLRGAGLASKNALC
jgi:hypothetical protein